MTGVVTLVRNKEKAKGLNTSLLLHAPVAEQDGLVACVDASDAELPQRELVWREHVHDGLVSLRPVLDTR